MSQPKPRIFRGRINSVGICNDAGNTCYFRIGKTFICCPKVNTKFLTNAYEKQWYMAVLVVGDRTFKVEHAGLSRKKKDTVRTEPMPIMKSMHIEEEEKE